MKTKDLKKLSMRDLVVRKQELEKELFECKIKNSIGQLANPLIIRATRKNLARVNTYIAQGGTHE